MIKIPRTYISQKYNLPKLYLLQQEDAYSRMRKLERIIKFV